MVGGKGKGSLFNSLTSPTNASAPISSNAAIPAQNPSANESYEQKTYMSFLESSFNINPASTLPPITEIYDHNLLKKEIKQLLLEKDALLSDIKKCLVFNYFYDHSELTLIQKQANVPINDSSSNNPANSLLAGLGNNIDREVNHIAGTVSNDPNVGLNYSNSSGLLFPTNTNISSPIKEIVNSNAGSTGKPQILIPSTPSNQPTSTTGSSTNASTKQNKHGITYYRIFTSETLKFLYLISKLQSGKAILKSKKTAVSSKSGEYLTKIYNLRIKTVNQLNWEISSFEASIARLKQIHKESFDAIELYCKELKEIDEAIIKQSQKDQVNEHMKLKEQIFQSDSDKLKAINEKLKFIIKNALMEIKMIYNNTTPVKYHPTSVSENINSQQKTTGKSPLRSKSTEVADDVVTRVLQNTNMELHSFSKEVNDKMDEWYRLTTQALERKKALFSSLKLEESNNDNNNSTNSINTNNNTNNTKVSFSKGKVISFSIKRFTNYCLTDKALSPTPQIGKGSTFSYEENLKEKYVSTKNYFKDHEHSLDKIHELNEEIRQRIIQESEKNHAKYDYFLKLQQNQFQKLVSKR